MDQLMAVAETVRGQCVDAALRAYEDAGISGLCAEGRWELAVQAIRGVDLRSSIAAAVEGKQD